jgi:hypothetical protein
VSRDLIDDFFPDGEEPDPPSTVEFYPGSRRKLDQRDEVPAVEFIADPWRENYTTKLIKGTDMKMYPIGALANALGTSVQSIRHWTRSGYIPAAPYRLPSNMVIKGEKVSGRRLYTEPLIDAAIAAFEERGLLGKPRIEWSKHRDLSIEIKETWSRLVKNPTEQPTTNPRSK